MNVKAVEFEAEIRQVKTMADGSVNIIINMPEHCREQAKVIMDWHHLVVRGVMTIEETVQSEHIKKTWLAN